MRITALNRNHNSIHLLSESCRHNGFLVFQLREVVCIVVADCACEKNSKSFSDFRTNSECYTRGKKNMHVKWEEK